MLRERFRVSERHACAIADQHRSTQRCRAKVPEKDIELVEEMKRIAARFPRWGYRLVGRVLRREGQKVNHKSVERLWRNEGMEVTQKKRKKRRLGDPSGG